MLLTIVSTFLLTSGLYGLAAFFACRRIGGHLRGNSFATGMVVEHIIQPLLLGRGNVQELEVEENLGTSTLELPTSATAASDGAGATIDRLV